MPIKKRWMQTVLRESEKAARPFPWAQRDHIQSVAPAPAPLKPVVFKQA